MTREETVGKCVGLVKQAKQLAADPQTDTHTKALAELVIELAKATWPETNWRCD